MSVEAEEIIILLPVATLSGLREEAKAQGREPAVVAAELLTQRYAVRATHFIVGPDEQQWWNHLTEAEQQAEITALNDAFADIEAGRTKPTSQVVDEVRERHGFPTGCFMRRLEFESDDSQPRIRSIVIFTDKAQQDADAVYLWLNRHSPKFALRWYQGLFAATERIPEQPLAHAVAPESVMYGREVRQLVYRQAHTVYRVLYYSVAPEPDEEFGTIYVLRVRNAVMRFLSDTDISVDSGESNEP